jgi:hypothetical protein
VRVWDDDGAGEPLDNPAALRAHIRDQPFRSLATARDLPGGWVVRCQPGEIPAIVETVYPGVLADWWAARCGRLQRHSLADTAARQTGNYRRLAALSSAGQEQITAQVCAGCVCAPRWMGALEAAQGDQLPCPEACNHWLSAALNAEEGAG